LSFAENFDITKLESLWSCWCDPTFSSFSRTPTYDRQTYDYGTYHASMAWRGKNGKVH